MNTEQQQPTQTVVIISNIPAETKVMSDQDQLKEEVLKNTIQSWENAKKDAQISAEAAKMITAQNMELLKHQAGLIPDHRNITSDNLDIAKERAAESLEYAKIGIAETAENAKEAFLENAEKTKVQAEVKLEEVKEKIEEKAEIVKEQIVETAGIVKEQIVETAEIAKEKIVETAGIVKEQIVETAQEVKKDAAETMAVTKRDAAVNLEIAKEKVGENTEAAKEAMSDNLLYAKDVLTWAKDQLFGAAENAKEQVSENLDDLKERATETAVENLDSAKKNLEENKNERAIQNQNDEIRVKAKELHDRNLEHVHVEKTTGTGIDSVEITRAQVGQKIENLKDRATETAVENLDSAKKNLVENKNESVIPNQNQEIKVKAKEMHEKNLHNLEKNDRAKEKLVKPAFIKVDSLKRRNLESANKGVGNVVRNQELSAKEMHERIIGEN